MTTSLKVLLVEDNANDADLVLLHIKRSGEFTDVYSEVAWDLNGFIRLLCDKEWDIIICDYHLIGITAVDIIKVLDDYSSNIPIVVYSGSMSAFDEEQTPQPYFSKDDLHRIVPIIKRELEQVRGQEEIVKSWGTAIELKDRHTAGHTERVTRLSVELALKLQLCWPDVNNMRLGAYLHDVGKILVPDAILLKNGKLTEEEMQEMKNHTIYAYKLLRSLKFLKKAIDVPYCHHERWDGTGYPQGLKGREIPLLARIFSVVDNYDAMTTLRPYRGPLSVEFTLTYIYSNSERLFDPSVVNAFIEMMKEKL